MCIRDSGYFDYTNSLQFRSVGSSGVTLNNSITLNSNGSLVTRTITMGYTYLPVLDSDQVGYTVEGTIENSQLVPKDAYVQISTVTLTPGVWLITFNLSCMNGSGSGMFLQTTIFATLGTKFFLGQANSYGVSNFPVSSILTYTFSNSYNQQVIAYAQYLGTGTTVRVDSDRSYYQATRIA